MVEITKKKDILIITGGKVEGDFAALWVRKQSFKSCIAVDKGAETALELGLDIELLIGDFDSVSDSKLKEASAVAKKIIRLQPEKDATDTEIAIDEAIKLSPKDIYILGAVGSRIDHTFTTLMSLVRAKQKGFNAYAIDKYNKIYAGSGNICIEKEKQHGNFISIAVISDSAVISSEGMKYELNRSRVYRGDSLCQSNEISAQEAHICIHEGVALIFESKDEV